MNNITGDTFITDYNIKLYVNLYLNGKQMSLPIVLQNIPLGDWDVSRVTQMSNLFRDKINIPPLTNWDVSNVTCFQNMFTQSTFNHPINNWNVSNVENMQSMFKYSAFNQNISGWNVSNVTDMSEMFKFCEFNQNISGWNVSNVTDMSEMFMVSVFNQDISNWNVSNVTDMSQMFRVSVFNGDISNWNVSNVTDMSLIFYESAFNQDISNWNVSNVTDMREMFDESVFNQDISNWDVSNVTNMREMFANSAFNQDISNWDVSNVTNMRKMFSQSVFNQYISRWNVSNVTDMNEMFYESAFNQSINNWVMSQIVIIIDRVFENSNISPENLPNHYLSSHPIDSFSYLTDVTQIAPEPLSISLTPLSSIVKLDGFDPIQYENVNVQQYLDTDPNNIVFKAQRAIYLSSKQDIQSRYGQQTEHIKFECLRVGSLAPTNINKTDVYLSMRAFGIASFLVPVQQINEVLRNPNIRVIEISEQPIKMLNAIVSQQMIEARVPNAVGADHCQDGTATGVHFLSVISLNPELVGGFKYFGLKQQLKKTRKLRGYMVKFKTKTSRNVSKNKNPRRGKNVRTFRKH